MRHNYFSQISFHPHHYLHFVEWYRYYVSQFVYLLMVFNSHGDILSLLALHGWPRPTVLWCGSALALSRLADYSLITASRKQERSSQLQGQRSSYSIGGGRDLWATYIFSVQKPAGFPGNGRARPWVVEWREYYRLAMIHLWVSEPCALFFIFFYRHGPLTSHPPWHRGSWNSSRSSRAKLSERWLPLSRHTNYRVDIVLTNSPRGWEEETEAQLCMNRKRQRGGMKRWWYSKRYWLTLTASLFLVVWFLHRHDMKFDCTALHCL